MKTSSIIAAMSRTVMPTRNALLITAAAASIACSLGTSSATAGEPGWSPVIIPTGDYRAQIKSMPIEQRPYRPFHVYGNTVRRNHYRSYSPQSFLPPIYSPSLRNLASPVAPAATIRGRIFGR